MTNKLKVTCLENSLDHYSSEKKVSILIKNSLNLTSNEWYASIPATASNELTIEKVLKNPAIERKES